jgi:hypothetical protein
LRAIVRPPARPGLRCLLASAIRCVLLPAPLTPPLRAITLLHPRPPGCCRRPPAAWPLMAEGVAGGTGAGRNRGGPTWRCRRGLGADQDDAENGAGNLPAPATVLRPKGSYWYR